MIRRTFILVNAALLLAVIFVWVRSYLINEVFVHNNPRLVGTIFPKNGVVYVKMIPFQHGLVEIAPDAPRARLMTETWGHYRFLEFFDITAYGIHTSSHPGGWQFTSSWSGFPQFGFHDKRISRAQVFVHFPFWIVAIPPAILLTWGLLPVARRHRRRRKRLCLNCSYNLTGNVSGVCPECGERV